jgi:hypothetical protein
MSKLFQGFGVCIASLFLVVVASNYVRSEEAKSLFDGKTLDGWETIKEDSKWWSVKDGVIAGGDSSLKVDIPHNTFLSTKESYGDFELTLMIRLTGTEGFVNSGVQIRSERVKDSSEMSGYQVDAGDQWWGKLYDESRRNKVIAESKDQEKVFAAVKKGEWNEFRIVAKGRHIQSWINGVAAIDYTEADESIPQKGHIGVQVHGGGKTFVEFKEIKITRLD